MRKYLCGLIGLALLGGGPVLGQAPACGCQGGCGTEAGCNACGNTCDNCCPHCGCRLVPVCHIYCAPKAVTKHEYSCKCEEVCIPGVTPCCCKRCAGCDNCGQCGCGSCNNGCQEGCCCGHCKVRDVSRLVIHPVTKQVPERKCTVEWVCPNCSNCGQCGATSAPTMAPAAPLPPAKPAPAPTMPSPPAPKTTDAAPVPSEIGSLVAP